MTSLVSENGSRSASLPKTLADTATRMKGAADGLYACLSSAHLRKASERADNLKTCHAERSEASLQSFVNHRRKSNCGDPSRSLP